jgi:Asp/Glu/hydantoin racemase
MRIMVLNHSPSRVGTEYHGRAEGILRKYASPGTEIDLCYPDDYTGVQGAGSSHLGYWMAVPALVKKAVWAEQNGYDAVIQSNNFEPGVEASRLAVRIPVLGLCHTTMLFAANFADRIGVTVPLDGYLVLARRLLEAYGLTHWVSGLRSFGLTAVPRDEQVAAQRPMIRERAAEVMRGLVEETGAQCIVPLGGAIIPYVVDPADLQSDVGVSVLNPKAVGIRTAETCVQLGIAQSPQTYPLATLR